MINLNRFGIYSFALSLFLLSSSCEKQQELPAPATPVTTTQQLSFAKEIKSFYQEEKHDQALHTILTTKPLNGKNWHWEPIWNEAFEETSRSSSYYVYVPLEARSDDKSDKIKYFGSKKYLRFKRENQHWVCNIVEYFYKEKESNLSISRNIESYQHFISSFTGKLFVTEPLTKQVSSFDYVQGKRQTTQARSSAATSCLQYSCTWYLSCPPGFYIGEAIVVGTGGDSCEEPTGYTLSCGYDTRYQLTHSSVTNTCGGYGGPGDPGDPGDTGGGGDGTDDGGPFDPGIFTTEPATADPDLPSDCGSWQFQRVGPSGYMACGVTGIEIDLLSQFQNADGSPNVSLNVYRANLFFEMPARYTPGEAATICAQIKDEVEEFLEDLYRNQSPPQIAQSINSTFIREMRSRVASVGGRVTQTAQYPNTPVGPYGHTFLPNNGGCM